jgi:hypothetical protein
MQARFDKPVIEPTFPLAKPPTCRKCGSPGLYPEVHETNPIGNAGRSYYLCSGTHDNDKGYFIAFDDYGGIFNDNPRCRCRYTTRLCANRDGKSTFFACPIGQCNYERNGPLVSQLDDDVLAALSGLENDGDKMDCSWP